MHYYETRCVLVNGPIHCRQFFFGELAVIPKR
jgi:hypothetical protein